MALRARGNGRDGERKKEDKAAHGQEAESILRLEGDVLVGDALIGVVVGGRRGSGAGVAGVAA